MKKIIYSFSTILLTAILVFITKSYGFPTKAFNLVAAGCDPSVCGFKQGFMGECLCLKTQVEIPNLIINIIFYFVVSILLVWLIYKLSNKQK